MKRLSTILVSVVLLTLTLYLSATGHVGLGIIVLSCQVTIAILISIILQKNTAKLLHRGLSSRKMIKQNSENIERLLSSNLIVQKEIKAIGTKLEGFPNIWNRFTLIENGLESLKKNDENATGKLFPEILERISSLPKDPEYFTKSRRIDQQASERLRVYFKKQSAQADLTRLAIEDLITRFQNEAELRDSHENLVETTLRSIENDIVLSVSRFMEKLENFDQSIAEKRTIHSTEMAHYRSILLEKIDTLSEFASTLQRDMVHKGEKIIVQASKVAENISSLQEDVGQISNELVASSNLISNSLSTMSNNIERKNHDLFEAQSKNSTRLTHIIWDETRQIEAIIRLSNRIKPRWAMPPFGRWALDARSAMHLIWIVEHIKPKIIVELGSGTSSILLGYLAEELDAVVHSFDHLPKFAETTRELVKAHQLSKTVTVYDAPLVPTVIGTKKYQWYDMSELNDVGQIDLLIVDGPPGGTGRNVRYPAVPELFEKLSENAVIILDDSDRPDEKTIVAAWLEEYPQLRHYQMGLSRLAVLTANKDFVIDDSLDGDHSLGD